MSKNGIEYLGDEIDRIVDYARKEYDLTYAEIVGVLSMKGWLMMQEADERRDEVEGGAS